MSLEQLYNFAAKINGNDTEFVFGNFVNQNLIIITQYEKIGNIYCVKMDRIDNEFATLNPIYTINQLLGTDNIESMSAARYLAEKLKITKNLVICLSLKKYDKETITAILQAITMYNEKSSNSSS